MPELTAKRTLVKSPPELWNELSEADSLARHLGEFGEIKITRVEPETTVAWEGEHASGTVAIEASGWGTKVVLTASLPEVEAAAEPEVLEEPELPETPATEEVDMPGEDDAVDESIADFEARFTAEFGEKAGVVQEAHLTDRSRKTGFFGRLFGRKPKPAPIEAAPPAPVVLEEPEPELEEPEPVVVPEPELEAITISETEPEPVSVEPEPELEPVFDAARAQAVLDATLDNLGAAHHRPFSRG